jgi:hypothetical protein
VTEGLAVTLRNAIPRGDFISEDLELLDQYRRLQRVEPGIEPDANIVVLVAALAVHTDTIERCGELVVIGEDRAAIAVAAERLGREEARRSRDAKRADAPPIV